MPSSKRKAFPLIRNLLADHWRSSAIKKLLTFLINAYNAFTVELILTCYSDLKSIRR
jgi:hypothetical protein